MKFCSIIVIITGILLYLGGYGVIYYNYNLSPPAKLKEQIYVSQNYNKTIALFNEYQEKYINNESVSITTGKTDKLWSKLPEIPEGKYIHLYHWIFMDDLQLTVYFDNNGSVAYIDFIGD